MFCIVCVFPSTFLEEDPNLTQTLLIATGVDPILSQRIHIIHCNYHLPTEMIKLILGLPNSDIVKAAIAASVSKFNLKKMNSFAIYHVYTRSM